MKIQASELRIGNWYNSVKFNRPVMCELSDLSELYRRCDGGPCDESIIAGMFEPLVLTEEWLKYFGFTSHNGFQYYKDLFMVNMGNHGIVHIVYQNPDYVIPVQTNGYAVHQLQDLYRSLERKELKIKQP